MLRSRFIALVALVSVLLLLQAHSSCAGAGEPLTRGAAPKASFFFIGGGADETLADFVTLAQEQARARHKPANIAIVTHASSSPVEAGDELQNDFMSLDMKNTTVILPGSKVGIPQDCTAIFFSGGDQARLKRLLDEPLLGQLTTFEGLIGGSSAGSAIAATQMIARGMDQGVIRAKALRLVEGLNFLPGCVVDTHVDARARDTRLLAALALVPEAQLCIALDEDTAVYIRDGKARVYGVGHVRLFRRGQGFSSNIKETKRGLVSNVKNVVMSALAAGDEFDMPVPVSSKPDNKAPKKAESGDNK